MESSSPQFFCRPLVEELIPAPDVMQAFNALVGLPALLLLESAMHRDRLSRYSFLSADPFKQFELQQPEFGIDPFDVVREVMQTFQAETIPELPPFQGGAAGMLGYELGGCFEKTPTPSQDEFQIPVLAIGLYDWVVCWDHKTDQAWIISHGFPETNEKKRLAKAKQRLQEVKKRLNTKKEKSEYTPNKNSLEKELLAPQFSVPSNPNVMSNFSYDEYLDKVSQVVEYIYAGDIFQANLSQRLIFEQTTSAIELYKQLRVCNPAPFAGFFAWDDWAVVSASPERFLLLTEKEVETRPIKGTRRRQSTPEADLFTRDELRESDKDLAENVMIVDLLRNDLSRVCMPHSMRVPQLCAVETYETVQHLVSEIRGTLAPEHDVWDLFKATFPGGSITGAPKIRAMEIIAELEPTARGSYCGSFFYTGFNGNADSNILIRTFVCRNGWVQCSVGGGIVAQSNPTAEYNETLHKAEGMLRVL